MIINERWVWSTQSFVNYMSIFNRVLKKPKNDPWNIYKNLRDNKFYFDVNLFFVMD